MHPALRARLTFLVQVGSLFATGWMVWVTSLSARVHHSSWRNVIGEALGFAIFAWLASVAITYALYLAVPRGERTDVLRNTLRTSTAAVWFAPALILLSHFSVTGLAAATLLAVSAARLLYTQWQSPRDESYRADLPLPRYWRELAASVVVSFGLHGAWVADMLRLRLLTGALITMSVGMLTVQAISFGAADADNPRDLPRSFLAVVLTILLAAGLTVGGIRFAGRAGMDDGTEADGRPGNDHATPPAPPVPSAPAGVPQPAARASDRPDLKDSLGPPDGKFPGVILSPEIRPVTFLVAPVPAGTALSGPSARPYAIPFGGDYWMFRWPYHRPPSNSFAVKGAPTALSFSTTDHWPLNMEAHQKFDQSLDLRCCSRVDVEIRNADRDPATVSLELFAVGGNARETSLGTAPVLSVPNLAKEPIVPVAETLHFAIPAGADLSVCIELKVVFGRNRIHSDRSAKIALDRFVLVPKPL